MVEAHDDFFFDEPAQAFGHGEEVAAQDVAQEAEALRFAGHGPPGAVVVGTQGEPVADAVGVEALAGLQGPFLEFDGFDAELDLPVAELQGAHALLEKGVDLVGAFVEANHCGFAAQAFVLDQGVGVAQAFVAEVVVEEHVLAADGFHHRAPEFGELRGADLRLELYAQESDFFHKL